MRKEDKDNLFGWVLVVGAAFSLAVILFSCSSLGFGPSDAEVAQQRRTETVVDAVEDYAAGRLSADETMLVILRAYGEELRKPIDGGMDGLWEILGIAIASAVPAAGGAVTVLNRRRNATRQIELAKREERENELEEAIRSLEARIARKGGGTA